MTREPSALRLVVPLFCLS